jgi:hypothetical protein
VTRDEAHATSIVSEGPLRPKENDVLPDTTLKEELAKLNPLMGID